MIYIITSGSLPHEFNVHKLRSKHSPSLQKHHDVSKEVLAFGSQRNMADLVYHFGGLESECA
jgi:hypothetical protein